MRTSRHTTVLGLVALSLLVSLLCGCKGKPPTPAPSGLTATPEHLAAFINNPAGASEDLRAKATATLTKIGIATDHDYAALTVMSKPDAQLAMTALYLSGSGDSAEVVLFAKGAADNHWRHVRTLGPGMQPFTIELQQLGDLQWVVFTTTPEHGTGLARYQADWYPVAPGPTLGEPFTYAPKAHHIGWGTMVMDVEYVSHADLMPFADGEGLRIAVTALLNGSISEEGHLAYRWDDTANTFIYWPERSEWTEAQFDALWNGDNAELQAQFPSLPQDETSTPGRLDLEAFAEMQALQYLVPLAEDWDAANAALDEATWDITEVGDAHRFVITTSLGTTTLLVKNAEPGHIFTSDDILERTFMPAK